VEQLDALDRQIVAALVRNGRAPWRLIADVLGQQERTVARRGNKLLESGVVRTNSFINPSSVSSRSAFLLRVTAAPRNLRGVCTWLAEQEESSWVTALSGTNEAVAELFLSPDELGGLLYRRRGKIDGAGFGGGFRRARLAGFLFSGGYGRRFGRGSGLDRGFVSHQCSPLLGGRSICFVAI